MECLPLAMEDPFESDQKMRDPFQSINGRA